MTTNAPYKQNSSLIRRLICKALHGKKSLVWERSPMGWVDWDECKKCGAIHNVG